MGCAFGEVLAEELTGRFFTERPSNMRLVQCYMSKQLPMSEWAPDSWQGQHRQGPLRPHVAQCGHNCRRWLAYFAASQGAESGGLVV